MSDKLIPAPASGVSASVAVGRCEKCGADVPTGERLYCDRCERKVWRRQAKPAKPRPIFVQVLDESFGLILFLVVVGLPILIFCLWILYRLAVHFFGWL